MTNMRQREEIRKKFVPNETYYIKYNKKTEEDRRKQYREYRFVCFQDNDNLIFETIQGTYKECFSISDYISRYITILTKEEYKTEANKRLWEKIEKTINE